MTMTPHQIGPEATGPDMKRLLLAVVLTTLLFTFWQAFFAPKPVPKDLAGLEAPKATHIEAQAKAEAPLEEAPVVEGATPERLPEQELTFRADVAEKAAEDVAVKGGYRAVVTNQGAQLSAFELTGYVDVHRAPKDGKGEAPNIDLAPSQHAGARLLALKARGGDVALAPNDAYEVVFEDEDEVTLTRLTKSGVRVTRSYDFEDERFAFKHKVVLKNETSEEKEVALDLLLVGTERIDERDEGSLFAPSTDQLAAVCRAGEERERFASKDLEEPEALQGPVRYVGLDRHFFLAAVMPTKGTPTTGCRVTPWSEEQGGVMRQGLDLVVEHAAIKLAPGEEKVLEHVAYFGPKQLQALQQMGYGLDENIDFGWFGVLSRPMLWLLVKAYDLVGNFGLAIILLTLLVKLLTWPLTQKSYVSMQEMKKIAPEMKKLQEKYGHDRALLGQKQMELYKEHNINPMAGCLPVLIQMPIWFALYRTLWNSVELYQQPFYAGIADLSQPDAILFGFPLLPFLVGGLMLFQTMLQPPPQDQPQMKYIMWGMPIMFTFFMLQMPSGLSIYMITNSILTMAQQLYIKRKYA